MLILQTYIYLIISVIFIYGYGIILNNLIFDLKCKFIETCFLGIILLSFLGLLLNFFISLNIWINSTLLFIAIFPILKSFVKIKKNFKIILFLSFLSLVTMILDNTYRPDAGLYHLPYTKMINDYKVLFGSVNLEFRYGHISIMQYLNAVFFNFIFSTNGILIPTSLIFSISFGFFLLEFLKKNNSSILRSYCFFSSIVIISSMSRYSASGNDNPAHIFYLITTFYFLKFHLSKEKDQFKLLNCFAIFSFLLKQFYGMALIFPAIILFRKFDWRIIFSKCSFFLIVFVFLWFLKNFIVSSCLIYPINLTCFNNVEWSPKNSNSSAEEITNLSEAWAKAWPQRLDKNTSYKEHISNFKWILAWSEKHFYTVLNKIAPFIGIIIIIYIYNRNKIGPPYKKKIFAFLTTCFFINIFFVLVWFFKFPVFRYGAGYIYSFLILFNIFLLRIIPNKKNFLFFNKFIFFLLFIILIKNFYRIGNNFNYEYVDYPWPKKNSHNINNEFVNNIKEFKQEGRVVYYLATDGLCMYRKSPCTPEILDEFFLKENIFLNYSGFVQKKNGGHGKN